LNIAEVVKEAERQQTLKLSIVKQMEAKQLALTKYSELVEKLELARITLTEFAKVTQEDIKNHIEDLVTLALQAVFDREWQFKLIFERKRNDFEVRPVIIENGEEFDPKDELGGGAIDIISYSLRIILFTLGFESDSNVEKVMWLDEPMKFVGTGDLMHRAGSMIRDISQTLGIQTIMITHDEELAEISDRAWEITHRDGKSIVTQTVGVKNRSSNKKKKVRVKA